MPAGHRRIIVGARDRRPAVTTIMRPETVSLDASADTRDQRFQQKTEQRMSELVQSTETLIDCQPIACVANASAQCREYGRGRIDGHAQQVAAKYFWR
jgi:ABC-type polysaccharide/polyol phosphate transport system ATPase subunit